MRKRLLCILLILVLCCSCISLSIFTNAEEAYPVGNSFLGSVYSPFGSSQNASYYKNSGGLIQQPRFPVLQWPVLCFILNFILVMFIHSSSVIV